jgi:TolB-like protein
MRKFLTELKRRNVFPLFGLPDWSVTLMLALSALGFPIAIICAWAFDLTPEGVVRAQSVAPEEHHPLSVVRIIEFAVIGVLVLTVGYLYFERLSLQRYEQATKGEELAETGLVTEQRSIAVLPFVNMSGDSENEYFSDGISEELLNALVRIPDLKVAARTSSFYFKGKNEDIKVIGEKLGVQTLLEGSVRKAGNRVRITAQLINIADGYHIWSDSYDRELDDIFAVQDEIARAIVTALKVRLVIPQDQPVVMHGTDSVEAYNWFLRGLYHSNQVTLGSYAKTIAAMTRAAEIDPGYAEPHGYMASKHIQLSNFGLPWSQQAPLIKQAFERALALNPRLAPALGAKGTYMALGQWDWQEVEDHFLHAIAISDDQEYLKLGYALTFLMPLGRLTEAQVIMAKAYARDPLSPMLRLLYGSIAFLNHDFDDAREAWEPLANQREIIDTGLCHLYFITGNTKIDSLADNMLSRYGRENIHTLACLTHRHIAKERLEEAKKTYAESVALVKEHNGPYIFLANLAVDLGEIEEAMDWYEQSYLLLEPQIVLIRNRTQSDRELVTNSRFQGLLQKMNLDDESLVEMGFLQ